MKLLRSTVAAMALTLATAVTPAWACSFVLPPYEGFDRREYVFYGEVTGYTSVTPRNCARVDRNDCKPSWGVVLKVLQPVHMPRKSSTVELFEFGLDASCGRLEVEEAEVRKVALGSRFKVVAREIEHAQAANADSSPALDGSDWVGAIAVLSVAMRMSSHSPSPVITTSVRPKIDAGATGSSSCARICCAWRAPGGRGCSRCPATAGRMR